MRRPTLRILVTAASRHEATSEVAKAIADTLERAGFEVVLQRPEEVGHLVGFNAAVLGSAIYAGRWLRPAKDLVERTFHQPAQHAGLALQHAQGTPDAAARVTR